PEPVCLPAADVGLVMPGLRRYRACGLADPHRRRGHGRLGPVVQAELSEDRGQMGLHRLLGKEQLAGDVAIAPPFRQEGEDARLTPGEAPSGAAGAPVLPVLTGP